MTELQKAGLWKRFAAWLFDGIITAVLACGIALILSAALGYDGYSQRLASAYEEYESMYSVDFDISLDEYDAMTPSERERYDEAYKTLISDEDAMHAYRMTVNLSLVIVSLSLLSALMVWEFAIPLVFKNGQTLGKKIFGICIMRTDSVRINSFGLLVRTLLGKFAVETMIPVYTVLALLLSGGSAFMLILTAALFVGQVIALLATTTNSSLHDLLSGTVVVDFSSQRIFDTPEALLAYKKEAHAAEHAAGKEKNKF